MLVVSSAALPSNQSLQTVLLDLINGERIKQGLKLLEWDEKLADAARDHAEVMSREGRLAHQFDGEPDLLQRLTLHDVRLDSASENVVYDVSAEGAHDAFAKSPRHLANMLNPGFDSVGISVVNVHGVLYVVEDFAHRLLDSDEAAAQQIAGRFAAIRRQSGLPPLEFIRSPRVEGLVEQMGEREVPDSHGQLSLPGVRSAASYATTSPDDIPASVGSLAALRSAGACAVGVRFMRTPKYPSGLFWVSIVLFNENTALARN
jgi:hypothetical protein